MAEAYRLKQDTSVPRLVRSGQNPDGTPFEETVGRSLNAGDYVLAEDMPPSMRESAERGEMDAVFEAASADEARQAQVGATEFGVFVPEHEAEAVVLQTYGHEVVPRDQAIDLLAAGADAARKAQEAAKADGADERPALTAATVPSLADVSRGDAEAVVPEDSQHVDEAKLAGVEAPPGRALGDDLAAAEGDEGAQKRQQEAANPRRVVRKAERGKAESTPKSSGGGGGGKQEGKSQ